MIWSCDATRRQVCYEGDTEYDDDWSETVRKAQQ